MELDKLLKGIAPANRLSKDAGRNVQPESSLAIRICSCVMLK